ncbi:polyprenyl synthetase family protein [Marinobacterium jannaschii]|uniref:polyprenyl synthetase family protein n=1 Tax=Marinobacterium jannaschii TaxID=64970 RepID=UPI0004830D03|nr:farnesyl diphosphate synthase [Marinobacterium jannaschii]
MSLKNLLQQYHQRVDRYLETSIRRDSIEPRLQEAMAYSLFNGGKRVRPVLVYMVNQLLGGELQQADRAAAAIECIHSYSLVHDDLPAMDDDDLRRGKPTCHIAFDEATAILAGDGLQCLAFELLSDDTAADPAILLQLIRTLAIASGDRGMVVGQAFDLAHVGQPLSIEQLQAMHRHKTGALLSAAIEMGAISSTQATTADIESLRRYGAAIGLAFQVKDDILDIEGDTETLGKPQGSDLDQNKPTYPALLGLEGAKARLKQLQQQAHEALQSYGTDADPLRQLADYIVERDH